MIAQNVNEHYSHISNGRAVLENVAKVTRLSQKAVTQKTMEVIHDAKTT